jgi:hypothetical protein
MNIDNNKQYEVVNDSTVAVPIFIIRKANIKLIEGNYYKTISLQKDTIISNLNAIVNINSSMIDELDKKLILQQELNNNLQKNLIANKKVNNILIGTTTVSVLGIIVLMLIK